MTDARAPHHAHGGHRVLVAEDNPEHREDICEILRSNGDSPRAVGTVEDALAAMDEEEFCYFVFDQALPANAGSLKAFISGGERLVTAARASDKRRTEDGDHVTPILAITDYSERSAFVTGLFELGISTFVLKPIDTNTNYFLEKRRGVLARAGRDDHAKCAALSRRAPVVAAASGESQARVVRLGVRGTATTTGRTAIEVNGARADMQDSKFVVVLRCIVAREREAGGWSSRDALGIGANRAATTLIRETFANLVPAGFDVLEGDRRGNFRLNPDVVVEAIDWDALATHPDAGVQRVAVERRKRLRGA